MSTLPELFRNTKSVYIKPSKQGGIFAVKISNASNDVDSLIQPESSSHLLVKKFSESRAGTSCTNRTNRTRRASSIVGIQRPYSRQSASNICDVNNYGTSRVSFAIMENIQASTYEADSIKNKLDEGMNDLGIIREDF